MRNVRRFFSNNWQLILLVFIAIIFVLGLLWFKLNSLAPGFSKEEVAYRSTHSNLRLVLDNPLYIPHSALTAILQVLGKHGILAMRSVSALYGFISVFVFYLILRSWHTFRIALLGTILFATSAWFLHVARLAMPDVTYLFLMVIILLGIWLQKGKWPKITLMGIAIVGTLLLYTPGLFWLILPGFVWQSRRIAREINQLPIWFGIVWGASIAVLLLPLIRAFWLEPSLIKPILGLPEQLPNIADIGKNLVNIPYKLFFRGPDQPGFWLGRLPLVDVFSTAMLVIGSYAYWFQLKLDRTKLLLGMPVMGTLLISLGGSVSITILLPFIYIVVAAGISLLLQQWFTVFPRNPLARITGASLVSLAILMACFYNINHYFVAWPHAPETKQAFSLQMTNSR
jgi:hypothetical protein